MANNKDRGSDDGKQSKPKKLVVIAHVESTVEAAQPSRLAEFQKNHRLAELQKILGSWECIYGADLKRNKWEVGPISCLENVFSTGSLACLQCGRCQAIKDCSENIGGHATISMLRGHIIATAEKNSATN